METLILTTKLHVYDINVKISFFSDFKLYKAILQSFQFIRDVLYKLTNPDWLRANTTNAIYCTWLLHAIRIKDCTAFYFHVL